MPDSPDKAGFLNEEDKIVAKARAVHQVGTAESHRVGGVSWRDVGAALLDLKVNPSLPTASFLTDILPELAHGVDVLLMQCQL